MPLRELPAMFMTLVRRLVCRPDGALGPLRQAANVLLALVLVTTAAVVFFYRLDKPSMWLDEIFHWNISRNTVHFIMNEGPLDWLQLSHLYYLATKWCDLVCGNHDLAARAPQAASATLTVLFAYLLGRRLFSTGAGVLAGVMIMADPLLVEYARQNRFYHMTSLGFIAAAYFFFTYLETRRWIHWTAFVLAATFLLRAGSFGIVVMAGIALLTLLLFLARLVAGVERAPYPVDFRLLCRVALAGACILILFMPYPVRLVQYYLSKGSAGGEMDGFWTGPFPLTVPALAAYVHDKAARWPDIQASSTPFALVFVAVLVGGVLTRRSRAAIFAILCLLVTLPIIHTMNKSHAEVMPKRFVFIWPPYYILLGGGVAMIARGAASLAAAAAARLRAGQRLTRAAASAVSAIAWLCMLRHIVWPLLAENVYHIGNLYFRERQSYKLIARVVSAEVGTNDLFWVSTAKNEYWLIEMPYWPSNVAVKPTPCDASVLKASSLSNAVATHGAVWLHEINPVQFGFGADAAVRLPVAGATEWVLKKEYADDAEARARDERRLLATVIDKAEFPECDAARRLTEVLMAEGATDAADRVALQIAGCPALYDAVNFASKHFQARGDEERARALFNRHVDVYWWMMSLQLHAARQAWATQDFAATFRYARGAAWLGDDPIASAHELATRALLGMSNTAGAKAWLARTERRVRRIVRNDPSRASRLNMLASLRAETIVDVKANLVEQWLNRWDDARGADSGRAVVAAIDNLSSNSVAWAQVCDDIARGNTDEPALRWLVAAVRAGDDKTALWRALKGLSDDATAHSWPVYVYAVDRMAPVDWYAALSVSWMDLGARKFGSIKVMPDNLLGWLACIYEKQRGWKGALEFLDYVADMRPNKAAWAHTCAAELELQNGRDNDALQRLQAHAKEIRAVPDMAQRALGLVVAMQTPESNAFAAALKDGAK